jgi:NADH-quinone oxidoreductase subunit K
MLITINIPPITYFLGISALMFLVGFIGVTLRKNAIVIFMSIELMFNAANLVFITFASFYNQINGQLFVLFVMAVAAADAAVGLALIVSIYRSRKNIDIDHVSEMKG